MKTKNDSRIKYVEKHFPIKQGLRLNSVSILLNIFDYFFVEKHFPIKQGLRLIIVSSVRCNNCSVEKHFPIKQGLRLGLFLAF